jgi:hypothetical protein
MSIENLTSKQLRRAASIKETIEELQNELNKLGEGSTTPAKTAKPKRKMSAAGRARIAAGQKARWAKKKGIKPTAKKARRKMSAAAKAKISAAAKARWAKAKASGKKRL